MATVYLARATGMAGFEREVALKLTHEHLRDEPAFTTALIDEARFAGRIRHSNVVSVLDVSDCPQGVFIVMDYVEGDSLAGIVATLTAQRRQVPLDVSLKILDDVLAGLHAAHELKDSAGRALHLVHRDVTPHNVLLGLDGVARLTDFGVATAARRMTKTQTGLVKGKLTYMSPEQVRAQPLDRTCDVWAAGVIAWELLSGRRLYDGLGEAAVLLKVSRETPPPLHHIRQDLPPTLTRAVMRALAFAPADRYPTAEAFGDALARAARSDGVHVADVRAVKSVVQPIVEPMLEKRRAKLKQLLGAVDTEVLQRPELPPSRPSVPELPRQNTASSTGADESSVITESDPGRPGGGAVTTSAAAATGITVYSGPKGLRPEHTATYGAAMELPEGALRPSQVPRSIAAASDKPWFWVAVFTPLVLLALTWLVFALRPSAGASTSAVTAAPAGEQPAAPPAVALDAEGATDKEEPIDLESLPPEQSAAPPATKAGTWSPPRRPAKAQPTATAEPTITPQPNPYPTRRP